MARLIRIRGRRYRRSFGAFLQQTPMSERMARYQARREEYLRAKERGKRRSDLTPPVPPEDLTALGVLSFRVVCPHHLYGRGRNVVGIAYVMPDWAVRSSDPDSRAVRACISNFDTGEFPCRTLPSSQSAVTWLTEKAREIPCK